MTLQKYTNKIKVRSNKQKPHFNCVKWGWVMEKFKLTQVMPLSWEKSLKGIDVVYVKVSNPSSAPLEHLLPQGEKERKGEVKKALSYKLFVHFCWFAQHVTATPDSFNVVFAI
jgi:hypothetical protein